MSTTDLACTSHAAPRRRARGAAASSLAAACSSNVQQPHRIQPTSYDWLSTAELDFHLVPAEHTTVEGLVGSPNIDNALT
jgi:hypothetical protein